MRIYLDNCAYNRPYDDQSQIRIRLESEAKLHVQQMVKDKQLELVTSYILDAENGNNRYEMKRNAIQNFMNENESFFVGEEHDPEVRAIAKEVQKTGVKSMDSLHVACAEIAKCKYFITTDDRLLKYKTDRIELVTPGEFIRKWEIEIDEKEHDRRAEDGGSENE